MREYTISGGDQGAQRLAILTSTLGESTSVFIKAAGIQKGWSGLDLGCGTGEVTRKLAGLVGENGQITGMDIDSRNIELATKSARHHGIKNIIYRQEDVHKWTPEPQNDVVYSRFLLSHLKDPQVVLQKVLRCLNPGGIVLLEDTDFSGHFSHPRSIHFDRYVKLYQELLDKRGANANIGPELPALLESVGFTSVEFRISHPAHIRGEGKRMAEITFQAIAPALIEEGLITPAESDEIQNGIVNFRQQQDTMLSLPRIFQVKAVNPRRSENPVQRTVI